MSMEECCACRAFVGSLVFLGFSGCSLVWSATASLPAAMVFWCAMAADVAMVVLLLRVGPVNEIAAALMEGFVWGACVVAIIAWIMPAQSDLRLGDEDLVGANSIGYLCAFALFFAQYLVREKQRKYGIAAILLAVTLLRTISKTSIVAFLVAESFLLIRDTSINRKTKVILVLGSAATMLAFSSLLLSYFDLYNNAGSGTNSETLTGRLGIWAVFLSEAVEKPWFGHGFHSAWNVIPPFGEFLARHAHNELLTAVLCIRCSRSLYARRPLWQSLPAHSKAFPGPVENLLARFPPLCPGAGTGRSGAV